MNTPAEPDDDRLRDLLRRARPAPPLPPGFAEAVWRRLENRRAPAPTVAGLWAWLDHWVESLLRPRVAWAGLGLLLLAGGLTGALVGVEQARQQAQERYLATVAPAELH